ncbi:MAG: uroporphyrinogen-III C-methyltransferase [Candidatus Margulisiibacteriota bacterium]
MEGKKIKPVVYLIGAGPGDPELLTIKAQRILASADVVLYDYLAHPNIVMMAHKAHKVCVGKKKGVNSMHQDQIHELLLAYAKTHLVIVRLKGGDPMIFGRCGEEMHVLKSHGIQYEIIPGITSAIAAPTYAGIPVTHRDHSHSVAFVTATRANDIQNMNIPTADTLILMMALLRIKPLVQRLLELRSKSTPITIIESGTLAGEKRLTGTLETILDLQESAQLKPPALMVVGDVAALGAEFNWRDHLPLRQQRFVVFRAIHQQSELRDELARLGAEVLTLPLNEIKRNETSLSSVDLNQYTHVVFTSENGVKSFFESLTILQKDIRELAHCMIIAIGQHTAQCLTQFGIYADMIPDMANSDQIIKQLKPQLSTNHSILIPTSSEASEDMKTQLIQSGAHVDQIPIYFNHSPSTLALGLEWIKPTDHFIFMNSVAVKRFYSELQGQKPGDKIFSIGPKTTSTLKSFNIESSIQASEPTIPSLIDAILKS